MTVQEIHKVAQPVEEHASRRRRNLWHSREREPVQICTCHNDLCQGDSMMRFVCEVVTHRYVQREEPSVMPVSLTFRISS